MSLWFLVEGHQKRCYFLNRNLSPLCIHWKFRQQNLHKFFQTGSIYSKFLKHSRLLTDIHRIHIKQILKNLLIYLASQLVGSWFPDQGLNPGPRQWKYRNRLMKKHSLLTCACLHYCCFTNMLDSVVYSY